MTGTPKSNRAVGDGGEDKAAEALLAAGYRLLSRNVRTKGGEIDIVAQEQDIVCFVEVRLRASATEAIQSIDVAKQRQLVRAAQGWMLRHGEVRCRFDVVAIGHDGTLQLLRDAFRPW
jgi:putative endonuclease